MDGGDSVPTAPARVSSQPPTDPVPTSSTFLSNPTTSVTPSTRTSKKPPAGTTSPPAPARETNPTLPNQSGPNLNADAEQVARNFILGWASFVWSDQPSPLAGQLARVKAWTTEDYYQALSEAREPAFLTSQQIARKETRTVTEITSCDLSTTRRSENLHVYRCTFIITTQSEASTPAAVGPIWDITLLNRGRGWFVDGHET
jgi:hypothetical protein